jgi:peptide/nickel transport system ATP-binding protein
VNGQLLEIRGLEIAPLARQKGKETGADKRILKGIDLDLMRGEVLGLIGESGAGKSTLGLASMGYVKRGLVHTAGRISIDGSELALDDTRQLQALRGRKVSYVAQSAAASFNPAHKLLSQVVEVAQIHGHIPSAQVVRRAIELFDRMGLPDPGQFGERYPHEVSGGQLQRAMTAMALVGQPDLIVFDEPTTALDVTTQIDVLAIIKEVIDEMHTAALYISHDLAVVSQIADRIKVLRNGEEIEEQPTQSLLSNPRQAYTRELLAVRHNTDLEQRQTKIEPLLRVDKVTAAYGTTEILTDVSIVLHRGANLAIVGESGSGKSTLARVITGLLPPKRGEVTYQGDSLMPALKDRSKLSLKSIQMIYQLPDVAMNPRQKVLDIISRPAYLLGNYSADEAVEWARELLGLVELDPSLGNKFPGQLSGGQKQRVCIARALAVNPEVIICDEITSALDPLVAQGILKLLQATQVKLGVSYIFITHDISLVRAIADEVVVMRHGRVVEQGTKQTIFTPPFEDYTHLLISSTPVTEAGWLESVIRERRIEAAGH